MSTAEKRPSNRSKPAPRPRRRRDPDIVGDARRVASDAASLARNAARAGDDLRRLIADHPLQAIGTAVGAGFVVGGGLSPAVLRSVAGLAGRLAMLVISRRFVSMLDDGNRRSTFDNDSESED